jgi:hypothetical protein
MGLSLVAALLFGQITPEQLAQVQVDRDKAQAEVQKKYGDRQPSELSQDERRDMIQEQRDAEDAVIAKSGLDPKELARYEAKLSLEDRAATRAAKQEIEDKEKREAEKKAKQEAEKAEKANQPVQIQKGFNDKNPVILEDKQNTATPTVEKGLPPDAVEDQNAASGTEREKDKGEAPKPAKPAKSKSKRR